MTRRLDSRGGIAGLCLVFALIVAGCGQKSEETMTAEPDSILASPDTSGGGAPDTTSTPPLPNPDVQIEQQLRALRQGLLGFVCPETMQVTRVSRVTARIAVGVDSAQLKSGLAPLGRPRVEAIRVSTTMKLRLVGDPSDFEIRTLGSGEEQLVAADQPTQWEWDVAPKTAGTHALELRASVKVHVPGWPEQQRDELVYARNIHVQVNAANMVSRALHAVGGAVGNKLVDAIAAAIVAVVMGAFVFNRRRKSPTDSGQRPEG